MGACGSEELVIQTERGNRRADRRLGPARTSVVEVYPISAGVKGGLAEQCSSM